MTPEERKRQRRIAEYKYLQSVNNLDRHEREEDSRPAPQPDSTHPDYDKYYDAWSRARTVLEGDDAVKLAGTRFLPRLQNQTPEEYEAYKQRASFFNATSRTADAYLGLIFRRPAFLKFPQSKSGQSSPLQNLFRSFTLDVNFLGTPLQVYAKEVVREVIAVGRAATLVDYEGEKENRPYISLYKAEQILNWRMERVGGRTVPTMIALYEGITEAPTTLLGQDCFKGQFQKQIRVLKLVDSSVLPHLGNSENNSPPPSIQLTGKTAYVVDIWRTLPEKRKGARTEEQWMKVSTTIPKRLGEPLPLIPLVFHGPRDSKVDIDKLPLSDIIALNLDHYRLDADYKHGMHFTALPTAWVSGFDHGAELKIGSSSAWITDTLGANAGYLEYTGQGLTTFERAMDRDERLLAILGSRLLEAQKRVGEAAQTVELRQNGENSILSSLAQSVSQSLTQMLQWVYWWKSTEPLPENIGEDKVLVELNTDFSTKGMDPQEIQAVVAAWQAGAISRETMTDLFRRGEILPEGRSVEEEISAIDSRKSLPTNHGKTTTTT